MTWLELIKLKLSEEKAKGKSPSIGDVTPMAKKEWVQIKEGKHPLYTQGKAQTFARKKKTGETKTKKNSKKSKSSNSNTSSSEDELRQLIDEIKLCGKCTKKVDKYMKKMKGGALPKLGTGPADTPAPSTPPTMAPEKAPGPQKGGNCGSCGGAVTQNGGGCGCGCNNSAL